MTAPVEVVGTKKISCEESGRKDRRHPHLLGSGLACDWGLKKLRALFALQGNRQLD